MIPGSHAARRDEFTWRARFTLVHGPLSARCKESELIRQTPLSNQAKGDHARATGEAAEQCTHGCVEGKIRRQAYAQAARDEPAGDRTEHRPASKHVSKGTDD